MKKAPSVSGGAWGEFDALTYDAQPPPGPPWAVVVVVVVMKSAFMEKNLDNLLSGVNDCMTCRAGSPSTPRKSRRSS